MYAPRDRDKVVSKSNTYFPHACWICYENNSEEGNPIVRECACRGEDNGFVHIKCLVKLAKAKIEDYGSNPFVNCSMDDPHPFVYCITCKQQFTGPARNALTKEYYQLFGKKSNLVANRFTVHSICQMAECYILEGDFGRAMELLQDVVGKVEAKIKFCAASKRLDPVKERLNFFLMMLLRRLARTHERTRSLTNMKACVEKCYAVTYALNVSTSAYLEESTHLHLQMLLSTYHFLIGNKIEALRLMEEVVSLTEYGDEVFSSIQLQNCAYLNLACNNRQLCIKQLRKATDLMTVVYGSDDACVKQHNHELEELAGGAYTGAKYINTGGSIWLELV